jgi:hypothetical protein
LSKWESRVKKIIEDEKKKHIAVYELDKKLYEVIHGFSPVDKKLLIEVINKACSDVNLIDSEIVEISIKPRYKHSEKESYQTIMIGIKGNFNGYIKIETGSGYRNTNEGQLDIFYIMLSDHEVVSFKEEQCRKMYKNYKDYTVEKLIDLALDNNYYLSYEDCYKNYEIWDKQPSEYSDSVKGELKVYDESKYYKRYKSKFENLSKITKYNSVKEYAEDVLDASHESITYEWYEYKL